MVKISVVMSVYNAATSLEETLDAILTQTFRDLELVVVDDGSTDATPEILARAADRDPRVRVLTQANTGLTRALIRGCAEARGEYIARHDAGDRSHPQRLEKQLALIEQGHVLVGLAARYTDPDGHQLYITTAEGEDTRRSLLTDGVGRIHGMTHHGGVIFRRDAYLAAGGYRPQFRVGQDLDLWVRLARLGTIAFCDEVLLDSTIEPYSISIVARDSQMLAAEIIVSLRDGGDQDALLALAERSLIKKRPTRRKQAAGHYFIARCLLAQGNPAWRKNAWRALGRWPLHLRAWWTVLTGPLGVRRR